MENAILKHWGFGGWEGVGFFYFYFFYLNEQNGSYNKLKEGAVL